MQSRFVGFSRAFLRGGLLATAFIGGILQAQAAVVSLEVDEHVGSSYHCTNYISLSSAGSYITYIDVQSRPISSSQLFETDYALEVGATQGPGNFSISFNVNVEDNGVDIRCIDHGTMSPNNTL